MALSAFHWQPVRSTKKIASIARRSGTRGLWQPKGCPGRSGSRGSISAQSASGSRQPSSQTACPFINSVPGSIHAQMGTDQILPSGIGS